MILVDEIDKPLRLGTQDNPTDPLHALLEPGQAAAFRDNLLEVEFCADSIFWIASGNNLETITPSIVDRFTVLHIDPPTETQMRAVVRSIFAGVIARYPGWFDAELADTVANRLGSVHPRAARRILDEACARAAADKRRDITVTDVDYGTSIHSSREVAQYRIGFV